MNDRASRPDDERQTPSDALINEAVPAVTRYESDLVASALSTSRRRAAVEDGLRQMLIAQEGSKTDAL